MKRLLFVGYVAVLVALALAANEPPASSEMALFAIITNEAPIFEIYFEAGSGVAVAHWYTTNVSLKIEGYYLEAVAAPVLGAVAPKFEFPYCEPTNIVVDPAFRGTIQIGKK